MGLDNLHNFSHHHGCFVLLKLTYPRTSSILAAHKLSVLLGMLAVLWTGVAQAATVKSVRLWRASDHTRIVLDLDAPVQHSLVMAANPARVILVVPDTRLKGSVNHLPLAKTPIDAVRSSVVNQQDLRLVFDLKSGVTPKSFTLKKHDKSDDRLVIDLYDQPGAAPVKTSVARAPAKPTDTSAAPVRNSPAQPRTAETGSVETGKPVASQDDAAGDITADEPVNFEDMAVPDKAAAPSPSLSRRRPILVAIDAGHGGEDTGALGPNHMREKDVTLAIAKELARVINAQPGYTARLTRTNDTFVVLQKRRDLARDMKADLFISIHADSFTDASAYGASVFALSRKGATSEMARFLAKRENESDLVGRVGGVSLEDKDAVLAGVLVDLSMTSTVNASLQLGSSVLDSISNLAPLHAKHVEQAGFVVLKSPDVPSILVETGFISNKTESRKLGSSSYRQKMAQAIFKGVDRYFAVHPAALPQPSIAESETPAAKPATKSPSKSRRKAADKPNS